MRIIFMGTPEFAVASLDALLTGGFNIVGVITAPDKPAGRGRQLQQSAVKKYALEKGLYIMQPEKLKAPEFLEELRSLKADLQVVVAFRMLPEAVWNMPSQGTVNLHASLLPQYRGAAPINWAIINGETHSGITTFKLQQEIDTGNVLMQQQVPIKPTDTAGNLHDALMEQGAQLLLATVRDIEKHHLNHTQPELTPQNDSLVTHAPKLFKDTCRINWNKPVMEVYNLIRGLSPYPTAFTQIDTGEGQPLNLKIFYGTPHESAHPGTNGSLSTDNKTYLNIQCNGGVLSVSDLQLEGKKRMPVAEFLKGFKIKENDHVF